MWKEDRMTYAGDDRYTWRTGIDVSEHDEDIDWQQVRDAGIDFVFIRAGYRGYSAGSLQQDAYFEKNLREAREAGLDVGTDVEFVDVESGTAAFAALNNADIDGALVFTPFRAQGVNDGYVILDYSGEIEGFEKHPCCRNIAETEKINADPDAYKAYLKALIQAYKFYQENQDETVEDIVKYVSVDPDIIRQETYGEHISSYPDPDKKTIVEWKDHMVDLGFFEDFDIESHVNTELYKSALDAVIQEHPDDAAFYEEMVKHYQEYDQ